LNLAKISIPPYRYFPTEMMETDGPKQWAKIRLLQACKRLKIPRQLQPTFSDLRDPNPNLAVSYCRRRVVSIPAFFPLQESISEWKDRCRQILERALEEDAAHFDWNFQTHVRNGHYTKITVTRDTTPIDIRYEWAAKRACLNTPFKQIAKESSHRASEDAVKKAVNRILREVGIKRGT